MSPTCLLIDHDDTLLSTFELRATMTASAIEAVFGARVDGAAFLSKAHGKSLQQMGAQFSSDEAEIDRFVTTYRARYYAKHTETLHVFEGIEPLVRALAERRVPMAVVTSKLGSGARAELQAVGLATCLPVVVGAEDVVNPKPDAEPLLMALERIGCAPECALMVGDTPADILGARAAGARSGAALWGTRSREALLAAEPDFRLESPADLAALFGVD